MQLELLMNCVNHISLGSISGSLDLALKLKYYLRPIKVHPKTHDPLPCHTRAFLRLTTAAGVIRHQRRDKLSPNASRYTCHVYPPFGDSTDYGATIIVHIIPPATHHTRKKCSPKTTGTKKASSCQGIMHRWSVGFTNKRTRKEFVRPCIPPVRIVCVFSWEWSYLERFRFLLRSCR